MGVYRRYILPRFVNLALGVRSTMEQRAKVVPRAWGRVLEIGIGPGHNLELLDPAKVDRVWAIDPVIETCRYARRRAREVPFAVEFLATSAEEIDLPDASADCVLSTYTLCTIPEVGAALGEVRRVLRPGGKLIFCEHGLAPEGGVRNWQHRLQPLWGRLAGGCHLNRAIPDLLRDARFRILDIDSSFVGGPRLLSYHYWGAAAPS